MSTAPSPVVVLEGVRLVKECVYDVVICVDERRMHFEFVYEPGKIDVLCNDRAFHDFFFSGEWPVAVPKAICRTLFSVARGETVHLPLKITSVVDCLSRG